MGGAPHFDGEVLICMRLHVRSSIPTSSALPSTCLSLAARLGKGRHDHKVASALSSTHLLTLIHAIPSSSAHIDLTNPRT